MNRYITKDVRLRAEQIEQWLPNQPVTIAVPVSDRAYWEGLAARLDVQALRTSAEQDAEAPCPVMTEDIYFSLERDPKSKQADTLCFSSLRRLERMALYECIEHNSRFLPAIQAAMLELCMRRSWVRPGHDKAFDYSDYRGGHGQIDLYASSMAWRLSVIDGCLGERLRADVRETVQKRVREKVLSVFWQRLSEDPQSICVNGHVPLFWLDSFDNWLAVCLSGVVCAGLYYEDKKSRALLAALYERLMPAYLQSLPEGYCLEGLAYWGYGFGKFIAASELLRRATGNRLDLYAQTDFLRAGRFGRSIALLPGVYPSVSDCGYGTTPDAFCMRYLSARERGDFQSDEQLDYSADNYLLLTAYGKGALPAPPLPAPPPDTRIRTWYQGQGILIARDERQRIAAYIQCGHNHAPHNHNDIGQFLLACGDETFVADPGFSVYDDVTFSRRRYAYDVLSSRGHSVPLAAGQMQGPQEYGALNITAGAQHAQGGFGEIRYYGRVTRTSFTQACDEIELDLTKAYDAPTLSSLTRTLRFDRCEQCAALTDTFAFSQPQAFESAIVTFLPVVIKEGCVYLQGRNSTVRVDGSGADAIQVTPVRDAVTGNHNVCAYPLRVAFQTTAQSGCITLRFTVEEKGLLS